MSKLLKLSSVTKCYEGEAQEVVAVRDASFTLSAHDYLAVVGPSGAGKSTLLHTIGGLEVPSSGQVLYCDNDIYSMKDKELALWRNKTVGFVFQFYHLIEELNVLENVMLASFSLNRKKVENRAKELLYYLEIDQRMNFFPSQLSGGEKQKVALARALVNNPQIVLCDEPTGNLDPDSQEKVLRLLEQLNKEMGKTIVIVTHNNEIAKRTKRLLKMKAGQVHEKA